MYQLYNILEQPLSFVLASNFISTYSRFSEVCVRRSTEFRRIRIHHHHSSNVNISTTSTMDLPDLGDAFILLHTPGLVTKPFDPPVSVILYSVPCAKCHERGCRWKSASESLGRAILVVPRNDAATAPSRATSAHAVASRTRASTEDPTTVCPQPATTLPLHMTTRRAHSRPAVPSSTRAVRAVGQ